MDKQFKCAFCGDTGVALRYGIEEPCRNCDANNQSSGAVIKTLTVTTDNEREQWIKLLSKCSDYHYDMAGQFSPEIIGDTEMEEVATIHRAWGKAIKDACELISYWEVETNDEVLTPPNTKNITPEKE